MKIYLGFDYKEFSKMSNIKTDKNSVKIFFDYVICTNGRFYGSDSFIMFNIDMKDYFFNNKEYYKVFNNKAIHINVLKMIGKLNNKKHQLYFNDETNELLVLDIKTNTPLEEMTCELKDYDYTTRNVNINNKETIKIPDYTLVGDGIIYGEHNHPSVCFNHHKLKSLTSCFKSSVEKHAIKLIFGETKESPIKIIPYISDSETSTFGFMIPTVDNFNSQIN